MPLFSDAPFAGAARCLPAAALLLPLVLCAPWAAATPLSFSSYLDAVDQHNLQLAAERESIRAAEAGIGIAALRPDPELGWSAAREQLHGNGHRPVSHGPSLSWMLETGGKRQARIQSAQSAVALALATRDGTRSTLYRDAASAWTAACLARDTLALKEQSLASLQRIVQANQARLQAGDIGMLELLRIRMEREHFQTEVRQLRAEHEASQLALALPIGQSAQTAASVDSLSCELQPALLPAGTGERLPAHLASRDEIKIANAQLQQAEAELRLAHTKRWVDPTLSLELTSVRGFAAGTDPDGLPVEALPRSRELKFAFALPLPISRRNRGDLVQADAARAQAALALQQATLGAEVEVGSAWRRYLAARDNLDQFQHGLLDDAQRTLDKLQLSYLHGASSLLELLDARRLADETRIAFLQARADLAHETVELQITLGQRPQL